MVRHRSARKSRCTLTALDTLGLESESSNASPDTVLRFTTRTPVLGFGSVAADAELDEFVKYE
jgi:hypothetical protein